MTQPGPHAVLTGPIRTDITLKDGTVVDVRPAVVYVDTLDQAQEVAEMVSDHYVAKGHPSHDEGAKFVHDKAQSRKNFAAARGTNGEKK